MISDTLNTLKELALQVRYATSEGENTSVRIGRILIGICDLLESWKIKSYESDNEDSLETLRIITKQILNATTKNENTAEKVGRVLVGIMNLLKQSGIQFEVVQGNDSMETLKALSLQVRAATKEGENTAERIGRIFIGILNLTILPDETPTEFLIRSDLPGMYYSGTQAALDAVKASYPDGLTRDVTISCVKPAKERRGGAAWVARLADWNLRSAYMLTLDGAGMLTYDCRSAGGLSFANVSNVRCHDISFVDVANGVDFPSPDELSAVLFRGEAGLYARNLYVDNCRITGATTLSGTDRNSYYSVISKYAENVYLVDNRIDQCHCIPVKTVECSLLVLVRNYIRADYSYGIIGHPALCTVSGCEALIAEDNELTGSTGEYYFYCRNVERVYMRRNRIHGGRGRIAEFASRNGMREVSFESNLVYDMLKAPSAAWVKELFALCRISAFHMNNNTFVMSGEWYEQYVTRGGEIAAADIFNNIVIGDNGDEGRYVGGFYFNMITTLNIGSNLYRMPVKAGESGTAHRSFIVVSNTDNDPGSVTLTGPVTSSIRQLNALGYETGSDLAAPDVRLLDGTYHPAAGFAYHSNETYTPATDADYKVKAETGNSRGCYNLAGTPIDETDEAAGFSGVDYSENKTFSSRLQYFVLADSLLLVAHNTPDRGRFIRFSAAGTQHSELVLGRYGLLRLLPVLDNNGEYSEDELYTVNIE